MAVYTGIYMSVVHCGSKPSSLIFQNFILKHFPQVLWMANESGFLKGSYTGEPLLLGFMQNF